MNQQELERARRELSELGRKARGLKEKIRGTEGAVMTRAQSAKIGELVDEEFPALQRKFGFLALSQAKKLLGDRLIVGSDYRERIGLNLGEHGPLPPNIIEILNEPCPVSGEGKRVYETHLLAWVPGRLTLTKLSVAVGGMPGNVLWSDWFISEASGLGAKSAGRGSWLLIPERCPPKTLGKNWEDSRSVLKADYPMYEQADALGFAAALTMYERKTAAASGTRQGTRIYPSQWGWCADRPWGATGGGLYVGFFSADGFCICVDNLANLNPLLGCAACWNFGTR